MYWGTHILSFALDKGGGHQGIDASVLGCADRIWEVAMSAARVKAKTGQKVAKTKPEVDEVTPELAALLDEFSDSELTTGVVEAPQGTLDGATMSAEEIATAYETAVLAESLSRLLRLARSSKQLSLAALAKRLKVSKARVHQLEDEGANLEMSTLCRFADALGYDVLLTLKDRDDGNTITAPVRIS